MELLYPLPVADCSIAVTITLIDVVDDPPDIINATSTNPDDSATVYWLKSKFITNTTQKG